MKHINAFIFAFLFAVLCVSQNAQAQSIPAPAGESFRQEGNASWYGTEFDGRPTASGEIFDSSRLTAAHPTLPFGTFLLVTNKNNNRQVAVKVNDRGPFVATRIIDVSKAAAEQLDLVYSGIAPVIIEEMRTGQQQPTVVQQPQYVPPPPQYVQPPQYAPPPQYAQQPQYAPPPPPPPAPPPAPPDPPEPPPPQPAAERAPEVQQQPIIPYPPVTVTVYAHPPVAPQPVTPPQPEVPPMALPPAPPPAPPAPPVDIVLAPPSLYIMEELPPPAPAPVPQYQPQYLPPPVASPSAARLIPSTVVHPDRMYKLQVGSFKMAQNAVSAFTRLKDNGLNPSYERADDFYRVVLSGVRGSEVQSVAEKLGAAGFNEAIIREER